MSESYEYDEKFSGIDYSQSPISQEYECCTFRNCSFARAGISNVKFVECTFEVCDLSMADIGNTLFRDVVFKQSKLIGLSFEECNKLLFSVHFEGCQLNFSSFYQMSLKKTCFKECRLEEVDFTETDLTEAIFHDCNLTGAVFDHTKLVRADLRTATSYTIDPENNDLSQARFSLPAVIGLLHNYDITIE